MSVPRNAFKRSLKKLYDYVDLNFGVDGSLPLPLPEAGDAGKVFKVNALETDYELVDDLTLDDLAITGQLTIGDIEIDEDTDSINLLDGATINVGTDNDVVIDDGGIALLAGADITIDGKSVALVKYAEDVNGGAIATEGVVLLTSVTAGAYTLAAPAAGDDGKHLVISAGTAQAHVVTLPNEILYDGTATPKDTITFDAQIGASCHLIAVNETYHLVGDCSTVTLSDEA